MDRESARQWMVRDTKRLAGLLEMGLSEPQALRSFCDTMRTLPSLLLERHPGLVAWTVFLLNRKELPDEARSTGLAALRWHLERDPDGEEAATWTENVRELLKAQGEDLDDDDARARARAAAPAPEPPPEPLDDAALARLDATKRVEHVLARRLGVPASRLAFAADLEIDFGADAALREALFGDVERVLGVTIPPEEQDRLTTVDDVIELARRVDAGG